MTGTSETIQSCAKPGTTSESKMAPRHAALLPAGPGREHQDEGARGDGAQKTPAYVENRPECWARSRDWVNATSRKLQPAFAVQTAIAFASTVAWRRIVSSQRNWPSLSLLNIAQER